MEIKRNRRFSDQIDILAWDNISKMLETKQVCYDCENISVILGAQIISNVSYILVDESLEGLGIPMYSVVTILDAELSHKAADMGFIRHTGLSTVVVIWRTPYSNTPNAEVFYGDLLLNSRFVDLVSVTNLLCPQNRMRNVVFDTKVHYLEILSGIKLVRVTDGEVDYTVEVALEDVDGEENICFLFLNARDGKVLLSEGMCHPVTLTPDKPMVTPTLKLHLETTGL